MTPREYEVLLNGEGPLDPRGMVFVKYARKLGRGGMVDVEKRGNRMLGRFNPGVFVRPPVS